MKLNHLDLHAPNVAETRDFFCDHLGFTQIETRGADGLAILHDDAGLELVCVFRRSRPVIPINHRPPIPISFRPGFRFEAGHLEDHLGRC